VKPGDVSKMIFAIAVSLSAVKSMNYSYLLAASCLVLIVFNLWGGRFSDIIKFTRYLIWLGLFIFILHLFSHSGQPLFDFWFLTASDNGAIIGFTYSMKLVVFSFSAILILKTVEPFGLIQPFERAAFKMGEAGGALAKILLSFSMAVRFVPDIVSQAESTLMAFRSRGIGFDGGLIRKAKTAAMLTAVLFVGAFKKSEKVAISMRIKGYSNRYERAKFPAPRLSYYSVIIIVISGLVLYTGWKL